MLCNKQQQEAITYSFTVLDLLVLFGIDCQIQAALSNGLIYGSVSMHMSQRCP
jgi:hypothetical protein